MGTNSGDTTIGAVICAQHGIDNKEVVARLNELHVWLCPSNSGNVRNTTEIMLRTLRDAVFIAKRLREGGVSDDAPRDKGQPSPAATLVRALLKRTAAHLAAFPEYASLLSGLSIDTA